MKTGEEGSSPAPQASLEVKVPEEHQHGGSALHGQVPVPRQGARPPRPGSPRLHQRMLFHQGTLEVNQGQGGCTRRFPRCFYFQVPPPMRWELAKDTIASGQQESSFSSRSWSPWAVGKGDARKS